MGNRDRVAGIQPSPATLVSGLLYTYTRRLYTVGQHAFRLSPVRGVDQTRGCFVWERGECARASEAPGRLDIDCPPARVRGLYAAESKRRQGQSE